MLSENRKQNTIASNIKKNQSRSNKTIELFSYFILNHQSTLCDHGNHKKGLFGLCQ